MDLLKTRGMTHGTWRQQADTAQFLKSELRLFQDSLRWNQREALEMIMTKISRILHGDADHKDHWDDIAGYAQLVSTEISDEAEAIKRSGPKGLRNGKTLEGHSRSKPAGKRRKRTAK